MTKKYCFKCGARKPLTEFYRHAKMADGRLNKCKACVKEYQHGRTEYEKNRAQTPERKAKELEYQRRRRIHYPEKVAAREAVGEAIRAGFLVRQPCEVCGALGSEAHHEDYGRPLHVRWLCFFHHREVHGQRPAPPIVQPGARG